MLRGLTASKNPVLVTPFYLTVMRGERWYMLHKIWYKLKTAFKASDTFCGSGKFTSPVHPTTRSPNVAELPIPHGERDDAIGAFGLQVLSRC